MDQRVSQSEAPRQPDRIVASQTAQEWDETAFPQFTRGSEADLWDVVMSSSAHNPSATPRPPAHHAQLLRHSAPCTSTCLGQDPIHDRGGAHTLQYEYICANLVATLLRTGETQCVTLPRGKKG